MRRAVRLLGTGVVTLVIGAAAWGADGDVVFTPKSADRDTPPAVFPHWSHRIRYRCDVCHPALFKMQANADPITMDAITEGKFCGACHNGTVAWPVTFETCQRCHRAP